MKVVEETRMMLLLMVKGRGFAASRSNRNINGAELSAGKSI